MIPFDSIILIWSWTPTRPHRNMCRNRKSCICKYLKVISIVDMRTRSIQIKKFPSKVMWCNRYHCFDLNISRPMTLPLDIWIHMGDPFGIFMKYPWLPLASGTYFERRPFQQNRARTRVVPRISWSVPVSHRDWKCPRLDALTVLVLVVQCVRLFPGNFRTLERSTVQRSKCTTPVFLSATKTAYEVLWKETTWRERTWKVNCMCLYVNIY